MEIRDHIFSERYNESKIIFVNGRFIRQINNNIKGSSKHKKINGINTFYISHEKVECENELYNKEALCEFCFNLTQDIKKLSKNIFFLQINATVFKRNCTINFLNGEEVVVNQFHGRVFCEIGIKNKSNIFSTVFDKGFSLNKEFHDLNWWEKIDTNLFITKFADIDQHLYKKRLKKGIYSVILSPYVSGQLAHETFGHIFEADNFDFNNHIIDSIGKDFYNNNFTVIDDPSINNGWGSMIYDDYGERQEKIEIIKNGRLSDKIKSGERINRLRRLNYTAPLISRVSNTIIMPSKVSADKLLTQCDNGIYIENTGQCYCDPITGEIILPIYEAFKIENGRKVYSLDNFNLYLNIIQVLNSIDLVANDFEINGIICGKMGQKIPVGIGAPSLLLKNIRIF